MAGDTDLTEPGKPKHCAKNDPVRQGKCRAGNEKSP